MAQLTGRYAQALFDLALEENLVDALYGEANDILALYRDQPDMKLLASPQLGAEGAAALLQKIFPGVSPRMMGLLAVMARKRRTEDIPGTLADFCQKVKDYRNIVSVEVFSAQPLHGGQLERIRETLAGKLRKTIEVTAVVDPSLIGGVLIKTEGYVIDNTVRGSIRRLHNSLSFC